MPGIRKIATYRLLITRIVFLYYLVFFIWRLYCHLLPAELALPAVAKMHYDLAFWAFRLSGLDNLIVQNVTGATVFTCLIIALCILSVLFPKKRLVIIPFTISYFLLAVIFNIYLCHSAHYLGGMVWITVAFWPAEDENFDLLWEAARYYACWVYASAFLWKITMGAFFQWDAGILTFKGNLAEYLYQNPATGLAHFYYFFLQHPLLLNIGHKIVFMAEGVFLIGFFTKKFDLLLIISALFIFMSIYFFSDVFFAELLIVIFPILPITAWKWLHNKIPYLNKEIHPNEYLLNRSVL